MKADIYYSPALFIQEINSRPFEITLILYKLPNASYLQYLFHYKNEM